MKANTSVFIVLKTKRELKCQFSGITEILWRTFWRNKWRSVFDVVKDSSYIIQLLFWPEKFDGFRIPLQFFKNSNAIWFFKQNFRCESLKIPNKYYERPPLQLLQIESWWKRRQYRNSQNITVKKINLIQILLGSYYKYWSYKCFDPYFLDQPVRIFVNGGKFSNQYV
jgi:hypothetical protein